MKYSTNYNMNKPELSEQYRLEHWNDNTDIIDTELKRIDDLESNIQNIIDSTFKTALLNFCYPIGTLYWSSKSTNPSQLFGGTWTQIKDQFILAAGDTYTAEATGGNATVTLTVANLPNHSHSMSHTHAVTAKGSVSSTFTGSSATTSSDGAHTHSYSYPYANGDIRYDGGGYTAYFHVYKDMNTSSNGAHTHTVTAKGTVTSTFTGSSATTSSISTSTTGSIGSGTAFSILPPYIVKYCWERTA